MQFTSLLALSASLLAAQVPAQYLNPLVNPEAYMNPNIGVNPHPNANPNPNINANPNPNINFNPMATPSMTPSVSASASASASFSMHHKPTHAMHSHAYPSMSMGPMNSLIPMHPFHPKSMVTKASSSKASFALPTPTPTPTHALHDMHAPPPFHPKHGGIAPVDPLAPGSEVAPVQLDQEHGQDIGNSFCMGTCYSKQEDAKCGKPYSSPLYQSAQNCWMCCFTSPDF